MGSRNRAFLPEGGFAFARRSQVVRMRKALADDGGFERHHGAIVGEGVGNFIRDTKQIGHEGRAPICAAACDASYTALRAASMWGAPLRWKTLKAAAKASPAPVGSTPFLGGAGMTSPKTLQPAKPSLITGTLARRSRSSTGTPSASASGSATNSTSGRSPLTSPALLAPPSSFRPAPHN